MSAKNKIRIGIAGYGNLGRGAEAAIRDNADMALAAVFTRRNPATVAIRTPGMPVLPWEEMERMTGEIDVLLLCGGSARDLPETAPRAAALFHTVDSYDNHARIPDYFAALDPAARAAGKVAVISTGWDPGLFSLNRLYAGAVLPRGGDYTFWGEGVSQGHSDAIRRLPGVADARQYTVPVPESVARVRAGEMPALTTREKHTRVCYVVPEEGTDRAGIEQAIQAMPAYFADYDTTVHFVTGEELARDHSGMPHGGCVIRSGVTGWEGESRQTIEYRLTLDSNPEFTAGVVVACARAAYRLGLEGGTGCKTILDLPPVLLSPLSAEELRTTLL